MSVNVTSGLTRPGVSSEPANGALASASAGSRALASWRLQPARTAGPATAAPVAARVAPRNRRRLQREASVVMAAPCGRPRLDHLGVDGDRAGMGEGEA